MQRVLLLLACCFVASQMSAYAYGQRASLVRTYNVDPTFSRWPNKTAILFYLDANYTIFERANIRAAVKKVMADMKDCLQFVEVPASDPRFKVRVSPFDSNGVLQSFCYSLPGQSNMLVSNGALEQLMVLTRGPSGCIGPGQMRLSMKYFAILTGKRNEHQRGDRDKYITVNEGNIVVPNSYRLYNTSEAYWGMFPYDYCSITHNQMTDYSSAGSLAFTVKAEPQYIPALSQLSYYDCSLLSRIYSCPPQNCAPLDCNAIRAGLGSTPEPVPTTPPLTTVPAPTQTTAPPTTTTSITTTTTTPPTTTTRLTTTPAPTTTTAPPTTTTPVATTTTTPPTTTTRLTTTPAPTTTTAPPTTTTPVATTTTTPPTTTTRLTTTPAPTTTTAPPTTTTPVATTTTTPPTTTTRLSTTPAPTTTTAPPTTTTPVATTTTTPPTTTTRLTTTPAPTTTTAPPTTTTPVATTTTTPPTTTTRLTTTPAPTTTTAPPTTTTPVATTTTTPPTTTTRLTTTPAPTTTTAPPTTTTPVATTTTTPPTTTTRLTTTPAPTTTTAPPTTTTPVATTTTTPPTTTTRLTTTPAPTTTTAPPTTTTPVATTTTTPPTTTTRLTTTPAPTTTTAPPTTTTPVATTTTTPPTTTTRLTTTPAPTTTTAPPTTTTPVATTTTTPPTTTTRLTTTPAPTTTTAPPTTTTPVATTTTTPPTTTTRLTTTPAPTTTTAPPTTTTPVATTTTTPPTTTMAVTTTHCVVTASPTTTTCPLTTFCSASPAESGFIDQPGSSQAYLLYASNCVLEYTVDWVGYKLIPQGSGELMTTYFPGIGGSTFPTPVTLAYNDYDSLNNWELNVVNPTCSMAITCATSFGSTHAITACPTAAATRPTPPNVATSASTIIEFSDFSAHQYIVLKSSGNTELGLTTADFSVIEMTTTNFLSGQTSITAITAIQIVSDPNYILNDMLVVFGTGSTGIPYVGFVDMLLTGVSIAPSTWRAEPQPLNLVLTGC